jgi:hypothetical protein
MIDSKQLKEYVIIPVLEKLDMFSESAVQLLLGTAAVESDMGHYLHQIKGPALGIYQMEPKTHNDIWDNYLKYRPELRQLMHDKITEKHIPNQLIGNLFYATAMARLHYKRAPAYLPEANNIDGLAKYWRNFYNTPKGAHSDKKAIAKFINKYEQYVRPYVY